MQVIIFAMATHGIFAQHISVGPTAASLQINMVIQGTVMPVPLTIPFTIVNWHKGGTKPNTSEIPAWNFGPG